MRLLEAARANPQLLCRRFDPRRGSERTWLFGIARSVALDHFRAEERRRRREERYAREAPGAEEDPLGGFSPELDAALRTLSRGEREVLALRILLDLDAEATARVLGIGRTACSSLRLRCSRSPR